MPFQIGRHVHPKAAADTPPPATPTGIDYLHLLEDRQTRALGQRLRYAQLTEPTGPVAEPPDHQPTADGDGLRYDTDLLGLAAHESAATASVEVTG